MLARVVNHMHNTDISLELRNLGDKFVWVGMKSGAFYGTLYSDQQQAIRGLRRHFSDNGTEINFSNGAGRGLHVLPAQAA